ncbi:MAG: hypothetical protein KAS71_16775 [Bacteroidales bacterium]|nr:hypothetical protein [Bacteroidales bacterium]
MVKNELMTDENVLEMDPQNKTESMIEIFTLDGNISKISYFSQEDEINKLKRSCSNGFFYKISFNGDVQESGRVCL